MLQAKKMKKNNTRLWYLGLFVILGILFWMVPYSHDEWAWGTQTGIDNLHRFFQGYNGRYFGDLISLVITRSVLIKAVFMSATLCLLVAALTHFIQALTTVRIRNLRGLILGLLFLVPTGLFAQIYGWPAAYVNFVPPMIAIVWLLTIHLQQLDKPMTLRKQIILGIGLTLGTQFFSENISIYMVILAIVLIIDQWLTHRNLRPFHGAMMLTSLVGVIVMLRNPAYSNAAANTDGYKKINTGIGYLIHKIYAVMIPNMFTNYAFILLLIAVLVTFLLWQQNLLKQWQNLLSIWFVWAYPVYGLFLMNHMQVGSTGINGMLLTAFTIAYYIALMIVLWQALDRYQRHAGIIALLSVGALSAPLLMADPIGPRSFYGTFVCWLLVALTLLMATLETSANVMHWFEVIGHSLAVTLVLFYGLAFAYSYYGQINRARIIDDALAKNAKVIHLPELPNTQLAWKTSTNDPTWNARFKLFYHIPQDVKVIFPDAPDYAIYK